MFLTLALFLCVEMSTHDLYPSIGACAKKLPAGLELDPVNEC